MFTVVFPGSFEFIHCFYRMYEWHRIWLCLAIKYCMWNAFTQVCIGLLLNLVIILLQFLLSPFTFVVVCKVKCKGIPKFISQSQIPVVLCFGIYLRSFEGDSITLILRGIKIMVVPLSFCLIFCSKLPYCYCRSIIMIFRRHSMQYLLMY